MTFEELMRAISDFIEKPYYPRTKVGEPRKPSKDEMLESMLIELSDSFGYVGFEPKMFYEFASFQKVVESKERNAKEAKFEKNLTFIIGQLVERKAIFKVSPNLYMLRGNDTPFALPSEVSA